MLQLWAHCAKYHGYRQCAESRVQKWLLKIPTNGGVVEKIPALIMNFLLCPFLLWNSRHFIIFLHSLVSENPFNVSIKITMKRKIILLWKFMRTEAEFRSCVTCSRDQNDFKNTGILCLFGFLVLVLFLWVPCQLPYLCSCRTYELGKKLQIIKNWD